MTDSVWSQGSNSDDPAHYWRTVLHNAPELTTLPLDRPRPPAASQPPSLFSFELGAELATTVEQLAAAHDATPATVLLTAFAALVTRYGGQRDLVLGTRRRHDFLPLRLSIDPAASFAENLRRASAATMADREPQHARLSQVLAALGCGPNPATHPLFQLAFTLVDAQAADGEPPATAPSGLDLTFVVTRHSDRLAARIAYATELFDEASIADLSRHYVTILRSALHQPEQLVAHLRLFDEAQAQATLREWNATGERIGDYDTIVQAFAAVVARQPDAPAALSTERAVSYAALDRASTQLAHLLRSRPIDWTRPIAVCLRPGEGYLISLLAVLKAGAPFLPLDPFYPSARLIDILSDAGSSLVISESSVPLDFGSVPRLDLDRAAADLARASCDPLPAYAGPETLAYVIYTSGTTGRAKGIEIRHRGVMNNLWDLNTRFAIGQGDRVLALSSPNFDMSVYETLGLLTAGAAVVLPAQDRAFEPRHWAELMAQHQVTLWNTAPAFLRMLLDHLESGEAPSVASLRLALLAGDWIGLDMPARLRAWAPRAQFVSLGGATELSVYSTIYVVDEVRPDWKSIPYGRPLANQEAYVLDDAFEPVPVGAVGELYFGGMGMARGYFARPTLTAEKFIPHPFAATPGERLYRTGDLVRLRRDGELELLGRKDFQVKIRGFRIELGEVEHVLSSHEGVAGCVAVALDVPGEGKQLHAFVVPDEASARPVWDAARIEADETLRAMTWKPLLAGRPLRVAGDAADGEDADLLLRHGIVVGAGARVLDVGAGIGRFALDLAARVDQVHVVAFERRPHLLEALQTNVAFHAARVDVLPIAPGDESQGATLSTVMRQYGIDAVDLLKIDLEGSDPAVLRGIDEQDWPKIEQLVIVGNDDPRALGDLCALLRAHGYAQPVIEPLAGTTRHALHARRRAAVASLAPAPQYRWSERTALLKAVRDLAKERLPSYMVPAQLHLVDRVPLTPNGKVDRLKLMSRARVSRAVGDAAAEPGRRDASGSYDFAADLGGALQRLLADVLGAVPEERSEPLVALGLESLMAMRLLNALRRDLGVSLSLRDLLGEEMTVERLETLLREHVASAPAPVPAPPQPAPLLSDSPRLPLSGPQKRLWFLHELAGEGPAYNIHYAYRLRGRLDVGALAAAFQTVVDRHESFRTTYHADESGPYQVIHSGVACPLPCSAASPDQLDALLEAFRSRPFDLSSDPMLRTELLRLGDDDQLLLINLHHIAADGWSTSRLFAELRAAYDACRQGTTPALPPLAGRSAEYALALGEPRPADVEYWTAQLRDAPALTTLPPSAARPHAPTYEAGVQFFALSPALSSDLRRLAKTSRSTLYTALMAAFTALIARRTGARDLVIGTPVANRTTPESEALIGLFINFVAIRIRLDPSLSFAALLDETRAVVNDALAHQALPFDRLVAQLDRQRSTGEHPVFQIAFEMVGASMFDLVLDGLQCERVPFRNTGAKFDLTVVMVEHPTHLSASIEYRRDLYSDEQIRALIDDFSAVLEAAAGDPLQSVAALPVTAEAAGPTPDARTQALAYWRRQLADAPSASALPSDRPRPVAPGPLDAEHGFRIAPALAVQLAQLSRDGEVPLTLTLLAGLQALLHRYSGERDLCVAAPVGAPAQLVPLRSELSGGQSFAELLGQVRRLAADAAAQAPLSWAELATEPALVLQALVAPADAPIALGGALADLALTFAPEADGALAVRLDYHADRLERATIERLATHLVELLTAAAQEPRLTLAELPLASVPERAQLADWSRAHSPLPVEHCLHEQFAAQAALRPDAVAVVCDGRALTYRELDERANQLAHHLRSLGVGPEQLVGLCVERSLELVIGLLGILKAGGAYLPLDPSYPEERLRFMIADAAVRLVVSDGTAPAWLDQAAQAVSLADPAIARQDRRAPTSGVRPEHLMYVIYTSGSTGRPKGALLTHANVARLFSSTRGWFAYQADEVWTMFHSYAFDFSVWELWGALLHGGRVVVVPYWVSRSPEAFYELVEREGVTMLSQTPSAFRQFDAVDATRRGRLALREIVFGGEALDPRSLADWYRRHGEDEPRLINMYGITETTVHVTYRVLRAADCDGSAGSAIGVGIGDLDVWLLDDRLEPVPVGVPGELYIGGAGVARGYLGRPELTAQRFVPHPFAVAERLYRSGDRARRRADGQLEFLGRGDEQVKIRGFRIELGEIEAALARQERVEHAVVLAQPDAVSGQRLVAYVVARDEGVELASRLRAALQRCLPDYMIPAAIVRLDALPLTANGKLDRRALPAPAVERGGERVYQAPRTDVERALAAVWSNVLGVAQVGVNDHFFALGGDSIRSIQVVAGARARGVAISIPQLFQLPVLADLAASAGQVAETTPLHRSLAPFSLLSEGDRARLPADLEDAYPLAQLQAGMLFHSELEADSAVYHDILSFHVAARFDASAFQQAIDELMRRHPLLRTSFDLSSYDEPLQLVHAHAALVVTFHDLRGLDPEARRQRLAAVIEDERQRPIDWTVAPLVRAAVCVVGDDRFRITLGMHHAILDGWSLATAVAELLEIYCARLAGRPAALLPPPAVGYRDFVALEREAIAGPARQHWLQQRDALTPQTLPRWWPARSGHRRVQVHEIADTAALTDGVRRLAAQLDVPLKSVLLAAHLHAQAVLSGGAEVLTGLVANGRPEAADGERLLGLFLNTLPLRQRVDVASWGELIRAAFAAETALLPMRRFPLAEIQQLVGKGPLFDVAFNYLHFHRLRAAVDETAFQIFDDELVVETNFTLLVEATLTVGTDLLKLALWYDTLELDSRQVEAMAELYRSTLRAMVADVETPAQHRARHVAAQQPRRSLPEREEAALAPIHTWFGAQAARTPEATAVIGGDAALSYRALDEESNRLAHLLRDNGVAPGSRVALCLERSTVALAVGVLATLKAGASYVPLDASYPSERLGFMLEDSRACLLVTDRGTTATWARGDVKVLALDTLAAQLAQAPCTTPPVEVALDELAYVIYTSGSTGRPKGVAMPHRPLAELVRWQCQASQLGPGARTLQFAPLSFDVSFQELFATWCAGGTLVLVDEETRRDPIALHRLLRHHEVARLFLPAVALQQLAEVGDREPPPASLREVITAGEQLQVTPALRALFASLPACTLENQYGPSETHVVTAHRLAGPPHHWPALPPIGVPVAGATVELLGSDGRPVPTGVTGELYIGGDAVSRGYLERPELTAQRYPPLPGGGRAYRTGDLARRNGDGVLEFLGRVDEQVKVRGHRVELGEVEAMLHEHPGVARCAVAVRDQAGRKQLVGYVVAGADAPSLEGLRDFLHERLPEYMVPSSFAWVTTLPLTPSGKVDRRALVALDAHVLTWQREARIAPNGPLETLLAGIFGSVLGVAEVRADDSFLALGGNSLTMVQAVLRVRDALEVELPLRSVFKAQTVAELATELGLLSGDRARLERVAGLVLEIEQLSDAEVEHRLADTRRQG